MRILSPSERGGSLIPALLLLIVSTLAIGWLEYRPLDPKAPILVWFSPRYSTGATFSAVIRAGGRIVANGPVPFSMIVQSNRPGFFSRLHHEGAWLLLDATGRGGCLSFSRSYN